MSLHLRQDILEQGLFKVWLIGSSLDSRLFRFYKFSLISITELAIYQVVSLYLRQDLLFFGFPLACFSQFGELIFFFQMGEDPTLSQARQLVWQKSVTNRVSHWMASGLPKLEKDALLAKYKIPEILEPPRLNAEAKASLSEAASRRDSSFVDQMALTGCAMACFGTALSQILSEQEDGLDQMELIELLSDGLRFLALCRLGQTATRRAFIEPGLDSKLRSALKDVKSGVFLFDTNLSEKVKEIKSLERVGQDLKASAGRNRLNFRAPQGRRPFLPPRGSSASASRARQQVFFGNRPQRPALAPPRPAFNQPQFQRHQKKGGGARSQFPSTRK